MKSKIRIISLTFSFFVFLLTSSSSVTFVSAQKKEKLNKITTSLGAQNVNSEYKGILDLSTGNVMGLKEASLKQPTVDLIYTYGKKTKANLLTPSSNRTKSFGKRYRESINKKWTVQNKGYFVNMRHGKKARKLYRKTKNRNQLVAAYNDAKRIVKTFEDYKKLRNGPAISLRHVEPGDVIVFKSMVKDLYAIGKVVEYKSGYRGSVSIDWKVAERK